MRAVKLTCHVSSKKAFRTIRVHRNRECPIESKRYFGNVALKPGNKFDRSTIYSRPVSVNSMPRSWFRRCETSESISEILA
jgi:hypothetical protein